MFGAIEVRTIHHVSIDTQWNRRPMYSISKSVVWIPEFFTVAFLLCNNKLLGKWGGMQNEHVVYLGVFAVLVKWNILLPNFFENFKQSGFFFVSNASTLFHHGKQD